MGIKNEIHSFHHPEGETKTIAAGKLKTGDTIFHDHKNGYNSTEHVVSHHSPVGSGSEKLMHTIHTTEKHDNSKHHQIHVPSHTSAVQIRSSTGKNMNESSKKIVEAFEISNADKIIESVESVIVQKLIEKVDTKKAEIGSKIFTESTPAPLSKDQDWAYDRLETKMKEAVDVVVESLLEGQEDLKTTVKETAKTLGVNESALHEYFETYFLGEVGTTGGAQKDPIDSDDDDPNYSNMNDKDADRKISYEHVVMEELSQLGVIKIGKYNYKVEKADIQPLIEVFHNLNEENQAKLVATLTEDVDGFSRMIEMSKKLTAGA